MAEKKSSAKKSPAKKSTASAKSSTKAVATKTTATAAVSRGAGLAASKGGLTLSQVIPNKHSRPKRTRVGRGHGSGMVKTGGEGGKGQTVRSGGGKGPAFEGGQTPWARRLPHNRGYSQKARDIGHFRTTFAVVNLHDLADWDASVEVTPQTLKVARKIKSLEDGVKILGGAKAGKALPSGLRFKDVLFSGSAKEALKAAGAQIEGALINSEQAE
ncbi:MAG: 50S ribosomal protein L15 [Verrucomicrobiota bacterium]|nr:50S ribosomal protein L15 [Verrucomicrobiota bacterium]